MILENYETPDKNWVYQVRLINILSKLLEGGFNESNKELIEQMIMITNKLIKIDSNEIAEVYLEFLNNFIDLPFNIQLYELLFLKTNTVEEVLDYFLYDYNLYTINAIRFISKLLNKNNENIFANYDQRIEEKLLNLDIFDYLTKLLETTKTAKAKLEIVSLINCFIYSSTEYVTNLTNNRLFKVLLNQLNNPNYELKANILKLILDISERKVFQFSMNIVSQGLCKQLIMLIDNSLDATILKRSLDILDNVFQTGEVIYNINNKNPFVYKFEVDGGVEILEKQQKCHFHEVYKHSMAILDRFILRKFDDLMDTR